MAEEHPRIKRLADYRPPDYEIPRIDLEFELDPVRTVVRARLEVRRVPGTAPGAPLVLDGKDLELLRILVDGRPPGANVAVLEAEVLTLHGLSETAIIELETACCPERNRSRSGLISLDGKLFTQCEPEGFRKLTFYPDRPDVLSVYTVTLKADPERFPVLLSNGDQVARGVEADGRAWVRFHDPYPKPSYIFAVMAGDWARLTDTHTTASGRRVDLGIYADRDSVERCRFAMEALKRSLVWDEDTYGLEYDLDVFNIVALSGWSGAMENKGLNLFGAAGILADPEIATDDDYIIIERIVGHEQFHNWTGNRVTCRDWFQLCLKEGLTRFRDQQFIEDRLDSEVWRIEAVKQLRRNQFAEDDGPAAHPVKPSAFAEIDNFYTNTVYDKGAEVIRMLRAILGPEVFRRGFDLYISRHDGHAATTEDFLAAMEEASGRDLTQFSLWYTQAGRPRLTAGGVWDENRRCYRLTLSQTCPQIAGPDTEAPFHIPVRMGLLSRSGAPLAFRSPNGGSTTEAVLELTAPTQTFTLSDVEEPPIPSLLRGFSAPVTLLNSLSDDDLAVLIVKDTDPVTRWDAGQTLAIRLVRRLSEDRSTGRPMCAPTAFLEAIGEIIDDAGAGNLLRALILTLPDEPNLSEGLARIDLDGLMAARAFLREAIVSRHRASLLAHYHALKETGPYAPDIPGIGRRKLRNVILELLNAEGSDECAELALNQMLAATNMTDSFEALSVLTHLDRPQRHRGVTAFYERWKSQPVVVDKWFNAQALSRAPGAVDDIIALERHPAFDPSNYSQATLFYGGFFRQNRVAFHDPSGKGYAFLADRLLEMDRLGRAGAHYLMPQINQWRRYDAGRQSLMREALERVAGAPGISNGLRENVSRALA